MNETDLWAALHRNMMPAERGRRGRRRRTRRYRRGVDRANHEGAVVRRAHAGRAGVARVGYHRRRRSGAGPDGAALDDDPQRVGGRESRCWSRVPSNCGPVNASRPGCGCDGADDVAVDRGLPTATTIRACRPGRPGYLGNRCRRKGFTAVGPPSRRPVAHLQPGRSGGTGAGACPAGRLLSPTAGPRARCPA